MGSIIAQGECRGQACLPMTEPQQELLGQGPSSLPPTKQKPPAKSRGFLKKGDSRSEAGMTNEPMICYFFKMVFSVERKWFMFASLSVS